MTDAITRLLAIDSELTTLREEIHRRYMQRDSLMRERSSILMSITFAQRAEYDRAIMARIAKPLDQVSAVRGGKP